jgi:SAM-dependent methyltransferase
MLSKADERARYGEHRNSGDNQGYVRFLGDFVDTAVLPWTRPGALVLDFGSGPEPVLAQLLRKKGYVCDIHDPMFATTRLWKRKLYDAILLHEVAEHFRDPATSFRVLASNLRPGGVLALRTRFSPDPRAASWPADFDAWWYRMDRTHVAFYRPETLVRFLETQGLAPVLVKEPDMLILARPLTR